MMKNKIPFIFLFTLMVILVLSGCIYSGQDEKYPDVTKATEPIRDKALPLPVYSVTLTGSNTSSSQGALAINISTKPANTNVSNLIVNYSDIRIIGQDDTADRIDENRKKIIVDAAIGDERVRALLLDDGIIEGVLYQCHPTPKNFSGPACAPALRVFHENINWDFLVDEKSLEVIFVQHDTPEGALL